MTKAKEQSLHREQWIHAPVAEVFAFFSEAENVDRITPPWLHFRNPHAPAKIDTGD